jgi:hypothetical protein
MSLEELFNNLSLDVVKDVVAAVKKDGVEKSGLADNYTVLAARCESSTDAEAIAALGTVKSLMVEAPEAQAFCKECFSAGKLRILCVFLAPAAPSHAYCLLYTSLASGGKQE